MATFWTYPNTIAQYVETGAEDNHISWNNISLGDIISNDKLSVVTNKNLYHIARYSHRKILKFKISYF